MEGEILVVELCHACIHACLGLAENATHFVRFISIVLSLSRPLHDSMSLSPILRRLSK